jgi:tetratricopeptide (TPR) repeat protein
MTSEARYQRLMQLLGRFSGRIDVKTAAMILRNRTALKDEPLALGNRNALDALIATHGVVVDLTDMVLWVSRGPHLLAPFVPVDLKPLFAIPLTALAQPEPIPADPLLDSPELARYQQAQRDLELARQLQKARRMERAIDFARRATLAEPESPDARKLLGDLLWDANRRDEARIHYDKFLKLRPPYLREVEQVKTRLDR